MDIVLASKVVSEQYDLSEKHRSALLEGKFVDTDGVSWDNPSVSKPVSPEIGS